MGVDLYKESTYTPENTVVFELTLLKTLCVFNWPIETAWGTALFLTRFLVYRGLSR